MKVTECLNTEHGVFLAQLGVLERMLIEEAPSGELRAVTLTIAQAVEKHRDAEEKILYPAILREFGEGFPPIQVMEAEHEEIGRLIRGVASGDGNVPQMVRGFIDVLRQHIGKEIKVLFPMAEQRIAGADLERMACLCVEQYHESAGVNPCEHGHQVRSGVADGT
ncbi:MAG: hemerythrin domain-containing protein [Candidatus Nanopelagicales bacterium]|nr:hemerythrin domain-containing protein [Candidatus Nanopelagicales bacterium]MDZ4250527.1 hemerythrin domain-containing protein [Candidatus Nanopelagicales bacterium]